MPEISVIVPVYNAERYLDDCVKSILAQTFSDIEVLLVENGSTDDSAALCDAWAQREERVRFFQTREKGVTVARRTGLENARGAYAAFVDSDDTIRPQMLQTLYEAQQKTGADIVQCGLLLLPEGAAEEQASQEGKPDTRFFTAQELREEWTLLFVRDGVYPIGIDGYMCNKLYKMQIARDAIRRLPYALRMREDLLFNLWAYELAAGKLELQDAPLYVYTQRPQSVSHRYDAAVLEQVALFHAALVEYCRENTLPEGGLSRISEHMLTGHLVQCILGRMALGEKIGQLRRIHRLMASNGQLLWEARRSGGALGVLLRLTALRLYWMVAVLSEAALHIRAKG